MQIRHFIRRLCGAGVALLLLTGLLALPAHPQAANKKQHVLNLSILYTTDLYGQVRDFRCKRPGVKDATYEPATRDISNLLYQVKKIRRTVLSRNDPGKIERDHGVLLFNTGDNLATAASTRFLLEFKGLAGVDFVAEIFNTFGYQLIGIGNHEFSVPYKSLKDFLQRSSLKGLKFSLGNLKSAPPQHVFSKEVNRGKLKYFVFNEASLKVGVFHVVPKSFEKVSENTRGLKFTEPSEAIEAIVPQLRNKEKVDLVVMLSHLDNKTKGKNIRELLSSYNEDPEKRVDLVITNGMRENDKPLSSVVIGGGNNAYIVGGYKYGKQLSRVDIRVAKSGSTSKILSLHTTAVPLKDNEYDPGLRRNLIKWERSYCKRWGKPLGKGRLRKEMSQEQFVKYFLNYMRYLSQAEVAIINKGAIRGGSHFPFKGYITKDDLYRAITFPQDIYVREMTGTQLNAIQKQDSLNMMGFDGSSVNGRSVVERGIYRVVTIKYVAENRGGWFNLMKKIQKKQKEEVTVKDKKGKEVTKTVIKTVTEEVALTTLEALNLWKPVRYKNGKVPEIRDMMISHFATNGYRELPKTPPPVPESDSDSKKPKPKPKPFGKSEIPFTGNFFRLQERPAWSYTGSLRGTFASIFVNPINLSSFYGDSQSFSNQFFQKYQLEGEVTMSLTMNTDKHNWKTDFTLGYTFFSASQFNNDTAQTTSLIQEERDEVILASKYEFKPFGTAERKWYHTNPFLRGTITTEMSPGNRPDLQAPLTAFNGVTAKRYFERTGESEVYHRFRVEGEAGLSFDFSNISMKLDLSLTVRKQLALNPYTSITVQRAQIDEQGADLNDLTINTDFNLGGTIKVELANLTLFKIDKTPFTWQSTARYTFLFQLGAFVSGLLTHDFAWSNTFAFALANNISLSFGADFYMFQGIFKPDPNKNSFQPGPIAFRIDPKVSLTLNWGARSQTF